jgi:antitoxin Phd
MASTPGTSKKGSGAERAAKPSGKSPRKPAPSRKGASARSSMVYMTSTEAQNAFGRVLDTVAREGTVLITKRNATQAVVMSFERYEALTRGTSSDLDELTAEFDDLLRRMQRPEARAGLRAAFRASPDELSRAAVAAARKSG